MMSCSILRNNSVESCEKCLVIANSPFFVSFAILWGAFLLTATDSGADYCIGTTGFRFCTTLPYTFWSWFEEEYDSRLDFANSLPFYSILNLSY